MARALRSRALGESASQHLAQQPWPMAQRPRTRGPARPTATRRDTSLPALAPRPGKHRLFDEAVARAAAAKRAAREAASDAPPGATTAASDAPDAPASPSRDQGAPPPADDDDAASCFTPRGVSGLLASIRDEVRRGRERHLEQKRLALDPVSRVGSTWLRASKVGARDPVKRAKKREAARGARGSSDSLGSVDSLGSLGSADSAGSGATGGGGGGSRGTALLLRIDLRGSEGERVPRRPRALAQVMSREQRHYDEDFEDARLFGSAAGGSGGLAPLSPPKPDWLLRPSGRPYS